MMVIWFDPNGDGNLNTGGKLYNDKFVKSLSNDNILLFRRSKFKFPLINIIFLFQFIWQMNKHGKKNDKFILDITNVVFNVVYILLARSVFKFKVQLISHHLDSVNSNSFSVKDFVRRFYRKKAIKLAHNIIVPSEFAAAQIKSISQKVEDKIRILNPFIQRNTIDFKKINHQGTLEAINLLFLGTVTDKRKRVYMLLHTLCLLPSKFSLTVVGSYNANSKYYIDLITFMESNGLHDRIHFTGRLSDKELELVFDRTHLLLMPSEMEGYGMAAAEAICRGIPVIANSIGGLKEVVDHAVNGYLIESIDARKMADKILEIFADTSGYDGLVHSCINSSVKFLTDEEFTNKAQFLLIS